MPPQILKILSRLNVFANFYIHLAVVPPKPLVLQTKIEQLTFLGEECFFELQQCSF